ncbi:unnamed protein product [Lactuca saligna]|uniref:Uncharacterized protein n=1 Tax=Lactuca saligna TaxID=75948 RepID=A0AA35ZNI2_LACSI|nr:unnamed protein product [Lactuca saligna]
MAKGGEACKWPSEVGGYSRLVETDEIRIKFAIKIETESEVAAGEVDEPEWMKGGSNEASSCSDGDVRREGSSFLRRRERSDAGWKKERNGCDFRVMQQRRDLRRSMFDHKRQRKKRGSPVFGRPQSVLTVSNQAANRWWIPTANREEQWVGGLLVVDHQQVRWR